MAFDIQNFASNKGVILACHITGFHDVNRNTTLESDNYELVRAWAESVAAAGLKGIIFHNNFSEQTCDRFQNESIAFVRVEHDPRFNPNVFRYLVYNDFLQHHIQHFTNIFITDICDVVVVQNPFIHPHFITNPEALFCGDEPKTLDDEWMWAHSTHLRSNIADFAAYESQFKQEALLNCGIIGGSASIMLNFIQQLCVLHERSNCDNHTAYTGDMGAFNYLARTQFNDRIKHGAPVNTTFKQYETERNDCWFRHK
jgi:hypothetical protein